MIKIVEGDSSGPLPSGWGSEIPISNDNMDHVNRWNYKDRDGLLNIVIGAAVGCEKMVTDKVKRELEMLKRHLIILKYVVENEPIGILKLAEETGIPSHKVRYSLRVLEQEGLIAASAPGAVTTERTESFLKDLDFSIDQLQEIIRGLKEVKVNGRIS
ncbi:MAG: hypothetical protein METHAR1v1_430013 [Methanothrix sp.]|nr:MAG: hypothetical protein METHAR1v1_430013 [Methanothrix sp.]